ncbi:MAG: hypoxanthine/guanine phosphoribosyltransferase [Methanomassiliicoccales archaeon]|jgi:adenine phosphoribosyltransferase
MLEGFKKSLESSTIVRMGAYEYIVSPITDGIPKVDPAVLREVLDRILEIGDFQCDLLVAPEAMGIPLVVPLSLQLGIPFTVVRKRRYGLSEEVSINQVTGYSEREMFINGIREGDRIVIVDDIVSTGGTLRAVVMALRSMRVELVDVIVAIEKGGGKAKLENELGVRVKTLVRIDIKDGRVILT